MLIVGIIVHTAIDQVRMDSLHLSALTIQERMEILKFFGSVIVTESLDLAEVELEQTIASEVLIESAKAFPF